MKREGLDLRLKRLAVYLVACLDVVLLALSPTLGLSDDVMMVTATRTEGTVMSWYYMPRTDGVQPAPEAAFKFVYNFGAYSAGDPAQKIIYLTFDEGYENGYTAQILDILKKHNVQAAFFVVEHYIKTNPDLVKRMVAEGQLVCNHSTHHKDMGSMADFNEFKNEIAGVENAFYEVTGKEMPKYFRPPEGKFSERCLKYAQQLGYSTIFWSFAYKDWLNNAQPDPEAAIQTIISRTHPGEVALLHATSKTNAQILDRVLTEWEKMGYTFKSLNYLARTYNPAG